MMVTAGKAHASRRVDPRGRELQALPVCGLAVKNATATGKLGNRMHQLESRQRRVESHPWQPASFVRPDHQSAEMVDHLIDFASTAASAPSAVFFWVGPQCEILAPQCLNIREGALGAYTECVGQQDPLHISRLRERQSRVAVLSQHQRQYSVSLDSEYKTHLASIHVGDEVVLVFWRKREPLACLSLLRTPRQRPFSLDGFDWHSLRSFVQASLNFHWRVRSMNVENLLTHKFGLKPRELEVVRYVLFGKSNSQIAEILGIGIPTVKSHIVSILNKTGVDSRLGIACFVHGLEIPQSNSFAYESDASGSSHKSEIDAKPVWS